MKKHLTNRLVSIGLHLKERIFTAVIIAGIGITAYGAFSLELATTIAGLALIVSGAIGLVMSIQTNSISASLHERFDRQDEIIKSIHKELMKNHEETMKNHEELKDILKSNHSETISVLKEILKVLREDRSKA